MADTHDNLEATDHAVKLFNSEKVEHVLHAGDLVSPFTASKFSNLEADFHYVWGNNEGDRGHIRSNFEKLGLEPPKEFKSLEIGEHRFALLHGTEEEIVDALAESGRYDVVIRGHTHELDIRKDPLIINPGATSGYLSNRRTVVILETDSMRAESVEI